MKKQENSFTSFPPFGSPNPKIIIIDTAPGAKSLDNKKYYADSRNCFWEMIACIYNNGKPIKDEDKEKILVKYGIALWDIYENGTRAGSADKNIENEVVRDIENYLSEHSNIKKIVFNGQKASDVYKKLKISGPNTFVANSTSGNNTHLNKAEKIAEWAKYL